MNEQEAREHYQIPDDVKLYEEPEDLPEGIDDVTPRSYIGSLVHGRCPKCDKEAGITIFRRDNRTSWCTGPEDEDGHSTEWEMVSHA